MTLVELLLAMTIMTMLAASLAALGSAVHSGVEYNDRRGMAAQHARVTLNRIQLAVQQAMATENYPGAVVITQSVGSQRFPDTLVVWRPSAAPANANGPPLASELVLFCADPAAPNRLLEITMPGNSTPVQMNDWLNTSAGRALIEGYKNSNTSVKVELTNRLRAASPSSSVTWPGDFRGCVRFVCELHPTATEMSQFRTGGLGWNDIAWPQNFHSSATGMRQVWVRTELQVVSTKTSQPAQAAEFIPFFGSAALYYALTK